MPTVTLRVGALDNKHDPIRLGQIADKRDPAISRLTLAQNVDIDDTDLAKRRAGRTQLIDIENPHSFWSHPLDQQLSFFVVGGVLMRFIPASNTAVAVRDFGFDLPVSYELVNGEIVCSNGIHIGWLDMSGFTPFSGAVDTFYATSLPGHILAFYNAVLYSANGSVLGQSLPYNVETRDVRLSRMQMDGYIRMLGAVEDGLWIATEKHVSFIRGGGSDDFQFIHVTDAVPPIGGFSVGWEGDEKSQRRVVRWVSADGFCTGRAGGSYENLSENDIAFPEGSRGLCLHKEHNGLSQYIAVIREPVGGNFYTPDPLLTNTIEVS